MFRGDHPDLRQTVVRAMAMADDLGHPRTGSEHLLLALSATDPVRGVLGRLGVTETALREVVRQVAPWGAGAAADRKTLAPLGIDMDELLSRVGPILLDRPPVREPLLPFGATRARRSCARLSPPLGLDAQAAYEASLRLALARRDHEHRPEHLALCLTAVDPGVAWILETLGVDSRALLAELAGAFPLPRRNFLLRVERRIGQRSRRHHLIRRYQCTTGRLVPPGAALRTLIVG